jgi:hypothetical protein
MSGLWVIGKSLLNKLLVAIPGALFGALRRRRVDGVIPGAALAFVLLAAVFGRPVGWNEARDTWHAFAIVAAGLAQVVLVGAKKRNFLDMPLDFRIVVAGSIGFFLRGAAHIVSGLIR